MFGYIYKITLPNGRCYVGCKKKDTFDENYWSSSLNPEYWKDLEKFGKENCIREILEWIENKENIGEREDYWILHEKALVKDGGYNLAIHCHPCLSKDIYQSKEYKEKMSKSVKAALKRKGGIWNKGLTKQTSISVNKSANTKKEMHWFTNGIIDTFCKECPEGFKPGRKKFSPQALYNIQKAAKDPKRNKKISKAKRLRDQLNRSTNLN